MDDYVATPAPELSDNSAPLYEMRDIVKSYGGVHALSGATLSCYAGEVHGLVGQNGAGKSTLIKIVSGAVRPDSGQLLVDGTELTVHTPADARAASVGTVFQELSLVPDLSVAMNVLYGDPEVTRFGRIRQRRLLTLAQERLDSIGLGSIDPSGLVRDLPLADRQTLEIAKVCLRQPKLLVLDEATSALHPTQVDWLHERMVEFVGNGGAIVFVSHRMQEVMEFSHRLTVFRNGQDVGTGLVSDFDHDSLIELMLGRRLDSSFPPKPDSVPGSEPICEVKGLASGRRLAEVDLQLRPGEIVGVAGLAGQGQRDLFMALYGSQPSQGEINVAGKSVLLRSPAQAIKAGIALIPEDRASEGLFLSLTIRDNISVTSLSGLSKAGWLLGQSVKKLVSRMISSLSVKVSSPNQEVGALSGGNQQKVLLARALAQNPKVILMYDATRGVDIGTKTEIYRLMREQCEKGVGVLFYSSDAAELVGVSDRVVVLHDGRLHAELSGEQLDEESVVRAVVGPRSVA